MLTRAHVFEYFSRSWMPCILGNEVDLCEVILIQNFVFVLIQFLEQEVVATVNLEVKLDQNVLMSVDYLRPYWSTD
jgi:hypothetical protein